MGDFFDEVEYESNPMYQTGSAIRAADWTRIALSRLLKVFATSFIIT